MLEGYPRYVRAGILKGLSVKDIVRHSDCPDDVKKRLADLLASSSGKVHSQHLKKVLRNSDGVDIRPQKIEFFDLEEVLKDEYPLKKNWIFKNTAFSGTRQLYPYGTDERLQIVCRHCEKPGKKVLEIVFHNVLSGKKRILWGETHIAIRTRALVALRTLVAGSLLSPSDFKEQFSYVMSEHESFVTNGKNLAFYKVNKTVQEGTVLKHSDMSSVHLVGAGKPVKTIIKKGGMKLTGVGIPVRSGRLGESVQVKGMDGKRFVIGKIVGFNKVEVEL